MCYRNLLSSTILNSHKKRKDILEGSLARVLFAAKLEFPKILVPRLPQHTMIRCKHWMCRKVSMVETTVLFICDQLLGDLIHLNFLILLLICFWLMMPGVSYVIYGCYSKRTSPEVSLYRSLNTGEKYYCSTVITQDRVIDEIWKGKLKTELCVLADYCYWLKFFNILAIGQKYVSFYPSSLFNNNIHS